MRLSLSMIYLLLTVLSPHIIVAKLSAVLNKQASLSSSFSSSTSSSPTLAAANHLHKSGKLMTISRHSQKKQQQHHQQQQQHLVQPKTLVVQIRSDHPVPLMFKGRSNLNSANIHHGQVLTNTPNVAYSKRQNYFVNTPNHLLGNSHSHVHHHLNAAASQLKTSRPIGPATLKNSAYTPFLYKPLKLKLANTKAKLKGGQSLQYRPATSYDVPFKYETANTATYINNNNVPKIPIESHPVFIADHFAPIYTVPAPNLAVQDNHLPQTEEPVIVSSTTLTGTTPKPQTYHHQRHHLSHDTHYEVDEEQTNDQTVVDPLSGSQKYYAPDPDPSLPTIHIRPSEEHFNQPSNNKPLPPDVQTSANQLTATPHAQPLVQYITVEPSASSQNFIPQHTPQHVYPVQYNQQYTHQYISEPQPQDHNLVAAAVPIYNPTYLVTKSNNLYNQYKQQQLFKPLTVLSNDYANADLTQEVASDGQILQSAKDPHNHQNLQFAALIAAPVLDQQQALETISYRLPNVASIKHHNGVASNYFHESPYYGHVGADSSQLLQAYVEEETDEQQQHQQQLQKQQQQHQAELQRQQDERAFLEQQQQQQQQQQQRKHEQHQLRQQMQQAHDKQNNFQLLFGQQPHQQQQQQQQQQQYQHRYQPENHYQQQVPQLVQQQQPHQQNSALKAFEEHERLVKQQLGHDTPLRIYVPDENETRLRKRSDDLQVKGYVDDVAHNVTKDNTDNNRNQADNENVQNDLFQVTSSMDVANVDTQPDEQTRSTIK